MKNKTVFVLLAGGKSERMGTPKGLLPYKNTFWILEQLRKISTSTIKEVYIGLGFNHLDYFSAIPWLKKSVFHFVEFENLKIKVVINKKPELGSFSTFQTVLNEIDSKKDILFTPIDIPILNFEELNKIIETENEIVVPNCNGKNGHPIKLSASFWNQLTSLDLNDPNTRLDFQLKKVNPTKISKVEVFDRAILYNLNTKIDWNSFLENQ